MNSLIASLGTTHLSFLVGVAETLGLSKISPASITYYHGPVTTTYDPDTGYTESFDETLTITDVLAGHYTREDITGSGGEITRADVMVIFAQDELKSEPTNADEFTYDGKRYEHFEHRIAAGLYLVGGKEKVTS